MLQKSWHPTCTDLILTNCPNYFQQNNVFETGLYDFHMIVVTESKMGFQKLKPQLYLIISTLIMNSSNQTLKIGPQKNIWNALRKMFFCIFNKHAPIKRKYFLANEAPFMTKGLHKVIKKKSRLRNKFLKTKSITDWEN